MSAVLGIALAASLAFVSPAAAQRNALHPLVMQGQNKAEQADFAGALAAFERAERAKNLSRNDLITLLDSRALVHFAMRSEGPLQRDLQWLAAIAPEHELDESAPPALRQLFDEVRSQRGEALLLRITHERDEARLRLRAQTEGAPSGMVRGVHLYTRVGSGAWREHKGAQVDLPVDARMSVAYYAYALGPGQAPIAQQGSLDHPLLSRAQSATGLQGAALDEEASTKVDETQEGRKRKRRIVLIVVGSVVAAAALATGLYFGLRPNDDTTQLGAPGVIRSGWIP